MAIARFHYVTCDRCGNPAGTTDDLADTPREARQTARALGWTHTVGAQYPDLCPTCDLR